MFRLSATLALLPFPVLAVAQPVHGLYIGGGVGANFATSLKDSQGHTKLRFDPGPLGEAAIGWGFGNGLRAEIEGSYRSNAVSRLSTLRVNGAFEPLAGVTGDAATYAVMADLDYDIPYQPLGLSVQPYVGAGLGYGWFDLDDLHGQGLAVFHLPNNNTFSGPYAASFGSGGAFAYQAKIGAEMPLRFAKGLSLTLEYRFFGTASADVPFTRTSVSSNKVNGVIPASTVHNSYSVLDNALILGLRYAF